MQNPQKRLSVWRDTKKDCRDTVGNDIKQYSSSLPYYHLIGFNKTEAVYSFPSKSVFEICGTDEPNRLHGYNCDGSWLNEPYMISKDTFDQLDMRTAEFVLIDWNPKDPGHWINELKKDERSIVIKSTFNDNPFCPPEQRTKILSYQPVSACSIAKQLTEAEAHVYDIEKNPKGFHVELLEELIRCKENERKGTANAFNWSVYGLGEKAERPNRILNWIEIPDDEYHRIKEKTYYGVDWGVVDPWGIIEAKYYDGALYLKELNYQSENEIKNSLLPAQIMEVNKHPEGLVGWRFRQLNIPKNHYVICDDNRPQKIIALREAGWDYAIQAIKGPGSIIDGIALLEKLKVFYTQSSKNIKHEQENYSRQVDRYGIVLEEADDSNNHTIDPTRYVAQFLRGSGIIKLI